jgi:hypothetical protein
MLGRIRGTINKGKKRFIRKDVMKVLGKTKVIFSEYKKNY